MWIEKDISASCAKGGALSQQVSDGIETLKRNNNFVYSGIGRNMFSEAQKRNADERCRHNKMNRSGNLSGLNRSGNVSGLNRSGNLSGLNKSGNLSGLNRSGNLSGLNRSGNLSGLNRSGNLSGLNRSGNLSGLNRSGNLSGLNKSGNLSGLNRSGNLSSLNNSTKWSSNETSKSATNAKGTKDVIENKTILKNTSKDVEPKLCANNESNFGKLDRVRKAERSDEFFGEDKLREKKIHTSEHKNERGNEMEKISNKISNVYAIKENELTYPHRRCNQKMMDTCDSNVSDWKKRNAYNINGTCYKNTQYLNNSILYNDSIMNNETVMCQELSETNKVGNVVVCEKVRDNCQRWNTQEREVEVEVEGEELFQTNNDVNVMISKRERKKEIEISYTNGITEASKENNGEGVKVVQEEDKHIVNDYNLLKKKKNELENMKNIIRNDISTLIKNTVNNHLSKNVDNKVQEAIEKNIRNFVENNLLHVVEKNAENVNKKYVYEKINEKISKELKKNVDLIYSSVRKNIDENINEKMEKNTEAVNAQLEQSVNNKIENNFEKIYNKISKNVGKQMEKQVENQVEKHVEKVVEEAVEEAVANQINKNMSDVQNSLLQNVNNELCRKMKIVGTNLNGKVREYISNELIKNVNLLHTRINENMNKELKKCISILNRNVDENLNDQMDKNAQIFLKNVCECLTEEIKNNMNEMEKNISFNWNDQVIEKIVNKCLQLSNSSEHVHTFNTLAMDHTKEVVDMVEGMTGRVKEAINKADVVMNLTKDMVERSNEIMERSNGIVERSNGIVERSNGIVERSNGIAERSNGIVERSNGIVERSNEIMERSKVMADLASDTLKESVSIEIRSCFDMLGKAIQENIREDLTIHLNGVENSEECTKRLETASIQMVQVMHTELTRHMGTLRENLDGIQGNVQMSLKEIIQTAMKESVEATMKESVEATMRKSVEAAVKDGIETILWDEIQKNLQISHSISYEQVRNDITRRNEENFETVLKNSKQNLDAIIRGQTSLSTHISKEMKFMKKIKSNINDVKTFLKTSINTFQRKVHDIMEKNTSTVINMNESLMNKINDYSPNMDKAMNSMHEQQIVKLVSIEREDNTLHIVQDVTKIVHNHLNLLDERVEKLVNDIIINGKINEEKTNELISRSRENISKDILENILKKELHLLLTHVEELFSNSNKSIAEHSNMLNDFKGVINQNNQNVMMERLKVMNDALDFQFQEKSKQFLSFIEEKLNQLFEKKIQCIRRKDDTHGAKHQLNAQKLSQRRLKFNCVNTKWGSKKRYLICKDVMMARKERNNAMNVRTDGKIGSVWNVRTVWNETRGKRATTTMTTTPFVDTNTNKEAHSKLIKDSNLQHDMNLQKQCASGNIKEQNKTQEMNRKRPIYIVNYLRNQNNDLIEVSQYLHKKKYARKHTFQDNRHECISD
ncbi:hypothetical protein, conserved [Plasmodium gonderi]|uniref:Uncharacterized protein n=1 Tax=Plasmodium gonderi TaxID=77519 RepID=A0A1Y1JI00_PLAGO|nr:hypothetical protein, conserved [Plasmodium gonderi]GAW80975.1 hypothetical protein, conserved [Plasmodium gonderi]